MAARWSASCAELESPASTSSGITHAKPVRHGTSFELTELRDKLEENTKFFREGLTSRGLTIKPGTHPIVPIMIGDAAKSQKFAARMLEKGVYVIGFFYPVVPHGTARVRTQVSAAHSREDLEFAVKAFAETNSELK